MATNYGKNLSVEVGKENEFGYLLTLLVLSLSAQPLVLESEYLRIL